MVKRSAFPLSAALFIIAAVSMPASSLADGPYISLLVGGVYTEDTDVDDIEVEYDTGFAFAGQFGYNFDNFRLGGELDYQIADGESDNDVRSEVGITRFVITGAVDFPIAGNNGPFVGGGFGVANLRTGDDLSDDFEDEDTAFTWHGEAGIHVALNDRFSVAPTYRYQWVDTDIGGQSEPLVSHIFGVSLRYFFYGGHHSGSYSSDRYSRPSSRGYDPYDSGYTSYGTRGRYNRYDRYDDDYYRHRHRHKKRERTEEELEKNRCGWKGPGCDDEPGDG